MKNLFTKVIQRKKVVLQRLSDKALVFASKRFDRSDISLAAKKDISILKRERTFVPAFI